MPRASATAPRCTTRKRTAQCPATPGYKETQSPQTAQTPNKTVPQMLDLGGSRHDIPRVRCGYPSTTNLRVCRPLNVDIGRGRGRQLVLPHGATPGIQGLRQVGPSHPHPQEGRANHRPLAGPQRSGEGLRATVHPKTQSTSSAPRTQAASTTHGPYPSPTSKITRRPHLKLLSPSWTPDESPGQKRSTNTTAGPK